MRHKQQHALTIRKSQSFFSLFSSQRSTGSSVTDNLSDSDESIYQHRDFARVIAERTGGEVPLFNSADFRAISEPYLQQVRLLRAKQQHVTTEGVLADFYNPIDVPYVSLRKERRFLFDVHTHPLHTILADAFEVDDLSMVHTKETAETGEDLLESFLDLSMKQRYQVAYDSFIKSFCIPLILEQCMAYGLGGHGRHKSTIYRYQAFPTIRIHTPGRSSRVLAPFCDMNTGHSVGCLKFHVPLTPSFGTNALFTESFPGHEDWHPLETSSVGMGYLYDGARCIQYELENSTNRTRVSLDFRIMLYSDSQQSSRNCILTPLHLAKDSYSQTGYYDECHWNGRRPRQQNQC